MIESIKRDFGMSDTQISLLVGVAFSLFYVTCGLVISRLADRSSRRNLLAAGAALWSLMTAISGAVNNAAQMFVARMAVGVGEGTIAPCGQSMIADSVPPGSLGKAMSVFSVGALIGSMLAFILGGLILGWADSRYPEGLSLPLMGHIFSWQLAFVLLGLPGLVFALLFALTVREPVRRKDRGRTYSLAEVYATVRRQWRLFLGLSLGGVLTQAACGGAAATWFPALIERKYGLAPEEAGPILAGSLVIPGVASAFLGGWLADRARSQGKLDSYATVAMLGALIAVIPFAAASRMPSVTGMAILAALGTLAGYATQPLSIAALQAISAPRMRSTVAALHGTVIVLLGYAIAPFVVAAFTDRVFQDEGALDQSLTIVIATGLSLSALCFAAARKPLAAALGEGLVPAAADPLLQKVAGKTRMEGNANP